MLIPTSGTTGRSKLVMQTHRAYAMAGEGFPWWMELTRRGPADDLAAAVPHQRAGVLRARARSRSAPGLVLLPRFSASGFLDSARRHGATEFNAIGAMLEILMRQPVRPDDAETDLRLCYTGPSPAREWQEAFEAEVRAAGRLRLRDVGVAVRTDLAARQRPFGTLGSPRQHPTLGTVNEVRVVDDDGRDVAPGETGELLLRNPTVTPGYWQMPEETAATVVDGWLHTRRPRHRERRRHLHVRLAQEGGAPAARPEPLADRGRGGDRDASRRPRGGRRRGALRADRGRGQGVRRRGARPQPRLRAAAGWTADGSRRSRSPVLAGGRTPSRAPRPPEWPSTASPRAPADEYDAEPEYDRRTGASDRR